MNKTYSVILLFVCFLYACTSTKIVGQSNTPQPTYFDSFVHHTAFAPAHIGVYVYDITAQKELFSHQHNKYFIPASNTKILTCYAAMKVLGDSLLGLQYMQDSTKTVVQFCGDPTLLHPSFSNQPILTFLKNQTAITVVKTPFSTSSWGNGWAWNDYDAAYMPQRSAIPIYGNIVQFTQEKNDLQVLPRFFKDSILQLNNSTNNFFDIERSYHNNQFKLVKSSKAFSSTQIPFNTSDTLAIQLLADTIKQKIELDNNAFTTKTNWQKLYTQSTDSVLKIMMQESDNFFAEQVLLMVGYTLKNVLNEKEAINHITQHQFAGLPNKIKWVDGSGLSRYNLVSPQSLVWVLTQMKQEFAWSRISNIFPTGNQGTLLGYYKNHVGKIYAKTGTLSNQVTLSGYVITQLGKELAFSIMVGNHQSNASDIKRLIEQFLMQVIARN